MSRQRILTGLLATAATACVLVLASGCGGDPSSPGGAGTDTAGSGVLETAATGTTATTTPAAALPSTAEQYTRNAINAWAAHDGSTLDQYEVDGGILHTMAGCAGCYNTEFTLAPDGCQGAAGSTYCRYFNRYGDDLLLKVTNELLGHPDAIVAGGSTFEPTTFPSDDQAYATEALKAWNAGNDNRLKLLTQAEMTSAQIDALGLTRGTGWTFHDCQGAAGSTYCQFTSGGHIIAFRFSNIVPNPVPTTGPDAQHRILGVTKQA